MRFFHIVRCHCLTNTEINAFSCIIVYYANGLLLQTSLVVSESISYYTVIIHNICEGNLIIKYGSDLLLQNVCKALTINLKFGLYILVDFAHCTDKFFLFPALLCEFYLQTLTHSSTEHNWQCTLQHHSNWQ